MAISKINPVAAASSINANAITATSADTMYEASVTLDPAIYTITCASATITNIQFFSNVNTLVTSAVTASGTVSINLASAADRVRLWTDTGSNVVVTITKTASAMSNVFSGTLDTVTTVGASTYTGTSTSGYGYAILVGGGGAGGSCTSGGSERSGGGGGSGGVGGKFVTLTGSMAVTIGAGGTGTAGQAGGAGGSSTFDGMTAGGGGGGALGDTNSVTTAGGAGGTVTGADISSTGKAGGQGNSETNGSATTEIYSFVKTGTTGSGGGGGYNNPGTGSGSGIGTGGNGGSASNPTAATGYGAGGGGAGNRQTSSAYTGANGTQGVLYVLRF